MLTDDIIEIQHSNRNPSDSSYLPKMISLMNTNETMKCRKVKAVIRYHTPSKTKQPELFFHHLLMLYITHGGMNLTSSEVIIYMCQNLVNQEYKIL